MNLQEKFVPRGTLKMGFSVSVFFHTVRNLLKIIFKYKSLALKSVLIAVKTHICEVVSKVCENIKPIKKATEIIIATTQTFVSKLYG